MIPYYLSFTIFILIIFLYRINIFNNYLPKDNIKKNHSVNSSNKTLLVNIFILFPVIFFNYEPKFFIFFFAVFSIGLIDDYINLKIILRFFFTILFSSVFFYLNKDFTLSKLVIFNYDFIFFPNSNLFFSLILILGFIHVMNMSDGRNGHSLLYFLSLYVFIIIFIKLENLSEYFEIIFSIILMLILNLINISYLGNSGINALSFFSGVILFNFYNSNLIFIQDIYLLFFIPFFDSAYVTFKRILNKTNPFKSDKNHLHHLPKNWNLALCIIIINNFFLFCINRIFDIHFLFFAIYTLLCYTSLRILFKKI